MRFARIMELSGAVTSRVKDGGNPVITQRPVGEPRRRAWLVLEAKPRRGRMPQADVPRGWEGAPLPQDVPTFDGYRVTGLIGEGGMGGMY